MSDESLAEHENCGGIGDYIISGVNINIIFNGSYSKKHKG